MYTTAITCNYKKKTYSITCRDLDKNKHWKRLSDSSIYDTTSASHSVYTVVYEGNKTVAERTKYRLEDAYELAGYTKIKIRA